MHTDLLLASLHHLLVFALVAMLVAEAGVLRGSLDAAGLRRMFKLDAGYGASAGLLLVVGLLRVFHGIKGADFYLHNPWFHAKLGTYVLVALVSIAPTLNFMRWRKASRTDAAFTPAAAQLARARGIIRFELVLIAMIFVLAAAMARYGGL
jgi:putative membrane protein